MTKVVEEVTLYRDHQPVTLRFTETKGEKREIHQYRVIEPAELRGIKEGVTSVTGFKDKSPILMQWAANEAIAHIRETCSENVQLEDKGDKLKSAFKDTQFYMISDAELEEARYAHKVKKDKAGDLGTRVHAYLEYLTKRELHIDIPAPELTDDMIPSVEGFLAWFKAHKPKTVFSERIVYSKDYDYAGKTDWGVELNGKYGIIDFKTGNCDEEYNTYRKTYTGRHRAKTEHFVQNAGYDIAICEEDGKSAKFYGVLYIPIDGKVRYFSTTDTSVAQGTFLSTLEAKRGWAYMNKLNEYQ